MIRVEMATPDFQLQARRLSNQLPTSCVKYVLSGIQTKPFDQI
jgi:hypothetical protein